MNDSDQCCQEIRSCALTAYAWSMICTDRTQLFSLQRRRSGVCGTRTDLFVMVDQMQIRCWDHSKFQSSRNTRWETTLSFYSLNTANLFWL